MFFRQAYKKVKGVEEMKKLFKPISLLLICLMVLTTLTACGGSKSAGTAAGTPAAGDAAKATEAPKPPEIVSLSVCFNDNNWGKAKDADLQGEFVKFMEQKTNTKITPIIPPAGNYNDKLNILVSSGDVPDVFVIQQAMYQLPNFASRGNVIALDDYIAKSPVISKIDKKMFDYIKVNNKIYYVPESRPQSKYIWLRKDMVDKFGIKLSGTPTTEEFYTEMKKVVGSGTIPLCILKFIDNFRLFYNAFGVYDGIYKDSSGKFVDGFNVPETKDALAYLVKMYKDGVIDKEFITNENATMREKMSKGMTAADTDYYNRYLYYTSESKKANALTDFIPVYTLIGPKGKQGNLNEAIQNAVVVSSKCKNPQRAFNLIEWLYYSGEGVAANNTGIAGKHYTVENGQAKPVQKAANSGYALDPGFVLSTFAKVDNLGFKWDPDVEKALPQQMKIAEESQKYLGPNFAVPSGISDAHDKVAPSIKSTREAIATKIVLGSVSIDDGLKEYANFWKSINGDEILKELTSKSK